MVTPGRMSRRRLLKRLDVARVEEAIRAAEKRTSGELCVSIAPAFWGDVRKTAEQAFVRMGIAKTKQRNGVLFFVVPTRRQFTVLGDAGIHEKVGQQFWDGLTAQMTQSFHEDDFTGEIEQVLSHDGCG